MQIELDNNGEVKFSETMSNHYSQSKKLIEDFFIIGVEDSDVVDISNKICSDDVKRRGIVDDHEVINMHAKVLSMQSQNNECQRRKVIREFCFPYPEEEQIKLQKLSNANEINCVLYGQRGSLRQNAYVFNMQADDMGDKAYQHENVFHCLCIINYEVVKIKRAKL